MPVTTPGPLNSSSTAAGPRWRRGRCRAPSGCCGRAGRSRRRGRARGRWGGGRAGRGGRRATGRGGPRLAGAGAGPARAGGADVRPGAPRAPAPTLYTAEGFFTTAGHEPVATACRSLLRRTGRSRQRRVDAAVHPDLRRLGVTAREAEVLALVGERLPNRDIAERLYLSPRTVEKHVASVLTKAGAASRADLIRLATTLGLTGS